MGTEAFIAASSAAPTVTSPHSASLKDAGVFYHTLRPQSSLRHTFKNSRSAPNCVVTNDTHVFAAQSEKSILHVYRRENGKHEASISFKSRIQSIALASRGSLLILGAEGGGLTLWEITTGRQVLSSPSHLGPVVALAVDITDNFVLSGSEDSTIHVWSLPDLLSFEHAPNVLRIEAKGPRHTLTGHRGAIAAIAMGHCKTNEDIAVAISRDMTASVWNYKLGRRIQTILLLSVPLCLAVDPADRGFYVGMVDGSIQLVNFLDLARSKNLTSGDMFATPMQSSLIDHMRSSASLPTRGAALCISLNHDSTMLLSGHECGSILSWDIGRRSLDSTVAEYVGSSITNIQMLQPTGFSSSSSSYFTPHTVTKPKPLDDFALPNKRYPIPSYNITTKFLPVYIRNPSIQDRQESSRVTAVPPSRFPSSILLDSILDLSCWDQNTASENRLGEKDMLSGATDLPQVYPIHGLSADEQIVHLKKQVAHLQQVFKLSQVQINGLAKERHDLKGQLRQLIGSRYGTETRASSHS